MNSAQVPVLHPLSSNALFNDLDHGRLSKPEAKTNLRKIASTTGEEYELKAILKN